MMSRFVFTYVGCSMASASVAPASDVAGLSNELRVNVSRSMAEPDPVRGPYQTEHKMYEHDGMDSSDHRIHVWYPTNTSRTYPLIAYAHGAGGGSGLTFVAYALLATQLAQFGYVVTAHCACDYGCRDPPTGWDEYFRQQLEVIAWSKRMAADDDEVFRLVNFDAGVGVSGHSMGGQSSLYSSFRSHPAAHGIGAAVMHYMWDRSTPPPAAEVPSLFMTGARDTTAPPAMSRNAFDQLAAGPRGYANKATTGHQAPTPLGYDNLLAQFTAAWFKLYLDRTPQDEWGFDYDEMIFGEGQTSMCQGGYGELVDCELLQQ